MPKTTRKAPTYFTRLPQGDPLADKPSKVKEQTPGAHAVNELLPKWMQEPVDTADDGQPRFPGLPDGQQWEHLTDQGDDADVDQDNPDAVRSAKARHGWVKVLAEERRAERPDSPLTTLEDGQVRLNRTSSKVLRDGGDSSLERLRSYGLELAKRVDSASNPVFNRSVAEGVAADDIPIPGTSFALMGIRGSFGREQVTTAKVEADRLFSDARDLRHGPGILDKETAPLNSRRARAMKPGERYRLSTERSVLAETGLKYTPILVPYLSSSMMHDLGFSGSVDFTVAVEGDTSIEITRGFGRKVAVCIQARDERSTPGKDRAFKASVGAFVDGSLAEYGSRMISKVAGKQVEEELESLEDKKRHMEQKVLPRTEAFNKVAAASVEQHSRDTAQSVGLYELVFDLGKPEARKIFDQMIGASKGERSFDLAAIAGLPADSGVELVHNRVRTASRKAVERTLGAFGYEAHRAEVSEHAETKEGPEGEGKRTIEETRAVVRRTRKPSTKAESTALGRVKTVRDEASGDTQTGVGFGWRYQLDDAHTSARELSEVLSFATAATGSSKATARLEALHRVSEALPRAKLLGMALGPRGVGETSFGFKVELNAEAVKGLFAMLEDDASAQPLWDRLARAYAEQKGLEEPPAWPVEGLHAEGVTAAVKRSFAGFKGSDAAFLVARNAVKLLEAARDAKDPVECARKLGEAFGLLHDELPLAGGLLGAIRDSGCDIDIKFDIVGLEQFDQLADLVPPDDGGGGGGGSEPAPEASPA